MIEHGVALIGQREGEHLDLRELVHAIEPPRSPPRGAGFRAEAVADPAQLDRQLLSLDDLAREQATQRDFGGGDQVQIGVLDTVDLGFRPAGNVARALQDFGVGQVGRHDRCEAFRHQQAGGELLQGQFQQYRFVAEEVESVAGDLRTALEINQVQLSCQIHVIEDGKIEFPGRMPAAADFQVGLIVRSHRRLRVRHVGNADLQTLDFLVQRVDFALHPVFLLPQLATFFFAGLARSPHRQLCRWTWRPRWRDD